MEPPADLTVDLTLYPTETGGKRLTIRSGYRCLCFTTRDTAAGGRDVMLLLGPAPLAPGESRRIGIACLTPAGAAELRAVGYFYLWEMRFIGEATVVDPP
ncbi:hypothetical protein [Zavarzinia aquatilis]|uniref:Uncharacterized protein n=1 Tax=Zavarzinia aquatilis TaxID=2211142 RepID=A0A317E2Q4_9PROT|nr:hypothetical protein [Zavarzinia aquatilis]PWR20436.1 hypothetical protein DKG74_15665 [Zavarzinia aquatilis]